MKYERKTFGPRPINVQRVPVYPRIGVRRILTFFLDHTTLTDKLGHAA